MASSPRAARRGGQILMRQLRIHGVRRIFMVPGESYLPCIDALLEHQGMIEPVVCRQEGGAAFMAEAHGKLTGEPGICFVTRGPGATNASIGVHTAFQDSTPMILFVGQVGNDFVEREAFQEIDYRRMFGQMAKWVAQIDRADRIPEFVARAFTVATSGRPGPVVLALPEDTLWGQAEVDDPPAYRKVQSRPDAAAMQELAARLAQARRPCMIIGGSGWTDAALAGMAAFAERFALPVATSWRRLECFDSYHPNFAGQAGWGMLDALRERLKSADLILAVGTRLGEETTEGYTIIESPSPRQALLHVYPDANEIGRVFGVEQAVVSGVCEFAAAAAALPAPVLDDGLARERQACVKQANDDYLAGLEPLSAPGPLSLDAAAKYVDGAVPRDACLTAGAGNYAHYPHRYRRFGGVGTNLSPTVGSMGYGLPAAIAAKFHDRSRTVVCYAGDGCFQMTMQELSVAMQHGLGIIVLVFNNGIYGTIRAHQEREFPGRVIGLDCANPDFSQIIRAYGGHGEIVETDAAFGPAFERARAFAEERQLPALLEIRYDADGIAPGVLLSDIRSKALRERGEA